MSEMSVSMILKLVDQVSGPAKGVESELQKLKRATDVLNDIQKGPMKSSKWDEGLKVVQQRRQEIEALQKSEQRAATVAETAARETTAAKTSAAASATAAAGQIVAANEKIAASEQRTLSTVERSSKEQTAAVQSLERQRSAAHAKMLKEQHEAAQARAEAGRALGNFALGAAATAVSIHSVVETGKRAIEAGAERQHVEVKGLNAGISATDMGRINAASKDAKRGAPNMSVTEIEELAIEARSAIKHPEELFDILGPLAKAGSVLRGMGVDNSGLAMIVKAAESLGRMNTPEQFKTYLDGQVRAMQVFGKTITPEQIYEAAKYSKSAGATLSDQFINGTMPSLIQEMRGSSAGDALSMLSRTLRGGLEHRGTGTQLLEDVGITPDEGKIHRNKAGKVTGYGGQVKGNDLLAADPARWVWEVWKPALEAHGKTTLQDQIEYTNRALPSTAANVVRILLQQEESIKQHQENLSKAADATQAAANQAREAASAFTALGKSLNDLGAAATKPAMESIAGGLNKITGAVNGLADWAEKHPTAAVTGASVGGAAALGGSGYLVYQLSKGFGLPSAAGQLSGAALALDGAAARLGAGGVVGNVAGGVGAAATAGGRAGLGLLAGGAAALPWFIGGGVAIAGGLYLLDQAIPSGAPVSGRGARPRKLPFEDAHDGDAHELTGFASDAGHWQAGIGRGASRRWVADTPRAPQPEWSPGAPVGWGQRVGATVDTVQIDQAKEKAETAQQAFQGLNMTLTPKIDMGSIDQFLAKINQATAAADRLGSRVRSGSTSFSPSSGALHDGPEAH
jgi:hypothetical protein